MINELLKQWEELQNVPTDRNPAKIQDKAKREITIAESLVHEGYDGKLNGFSLQFIIDDRRRAISHMNN
ncbi:MAG TPA: hypothetical protein VNU95_10465 [Candidatus Acidoferrales bacterium]|jgi:hypothetical protein|nr:hypothetical protein [Candidatus Acidoferrales bacterium]